jgi:hypothetical protein
MSAQTRKNSVLKFRMVFFFDELSLHLLLVNIIYMHKSLRIIIVVLAFVVSGALHAQPGPPVGPPCGGPFGPACPIDGGVSLLIAAGIAYGGKKSYDMARKKS